MSERKLGSVTYREVGEDYFDKRGLRRHAGVTSLWALGVGAVISGEYYGWNFGLGTGGFGGLLVAGVIMAIMYYGLVYSIAEMSPALPHTGGAYSFARSAMGPWGGFLTGLAENMEYVITPAVVVGAMGLLMQQIVVGLFEAGGSFAADGSIVDIAWWNSLPFWWALFYVIFVGINIIGIEATMKFTVGITVLSLVVLAFFFIAALVSGKFDPSLLDEPSDGRRRRRRLPRGWRRAVVPVRDRRHLQGPPVRDLVLPRDRRGSPGRGGVDGPAAGRPPRLGARDAHAGDRGRADAVHQHGAARRRFALRCVRFPAPRRLQGDLLGREGRVRAGHPLHDRPDRELLHDHLRVRAKHVLAVTRGILPFVPLDHPW